MKRAITLATAFVVCLSVSLKAEEIVISDNETKKINPQQAVIRKLNEEAGSNVIENPNDVKVQVIRKPANTNRRVNLLPVISRFLSADSDLKPQEAKITEKKRKTSSLPVIQQRKKPVAVQNPVQKQQEEKRWEGYCYFDRDITMTTAAMPVDLECAFKNGDDGVLHGTLVIDPKSFSLLFKPDYLTIGKKDYTVNGYALTSDKSSVNIADEVNKQFLKRVLTAMASEGATATLNAYKQYAQSKYSTTYLVGDTAVTDTQYPSNYPLVMGLLGMIDGAVRSVTSIIQSEMGQVPAIFKIYKGKTIFVVLSTKKLNVAIGGKVPYYQVSNSLSSFTTFSPPTVVALPTTTTTTPTTSSTTTAATTTATTTTEPAASTTTTTVTSIENATETTAFQAGQIIPVSCYFFMDKYIKPASDSGIPYLPSESASVACSTDLNGGHSLILTGSYSFNSAPLLYPNYFVKVYFVPQEAQADDGNRYLVEVDSPVEIAYFTTKIKDDEPTLVRFSVQKSFNILVKELIK